MTQKYPILIAVGYLLIAMMAIQSGSSLAKQLFPIVGPGGTVALRISLAALILLIVFRPWRVSLSLSQWRSMIIYGASLGGMQILFYFAIERIPLGIGVALEFSGPLLLALFSSKRKLDIVWVAFAICGMLLLLPDMTSSDALDPIGVLLALSAGCCWAGYIWFGQRAGRVGSGGMTVAIGMTVAAVIIFPIGVMTAESSIFTWSILPMALTIALLSSALPYSLEMLALKRLSTQHFSVMMSLEPAIAAMAGFLILHEQLALSQWLAISLIISASMGSTLSAQRKKYST
ncbi:EamA family transporter [Vibrio sp. V27_P1S3P104]|uniref:EamA family transporter n=1 Tax=unclassified Vibrio TaxID=2614977 RepID=UPI001372B356|nr:MULTISPECIES: DMT family transporter [unclassified Vibrio]NAX39105.1 EamA family transporter [Vibrio sp. V26_P1S5P106]NAW69508.1 EamA family transporter [Vibrio sp. V28_P6S34P95]NAX03658.1 EamA family transporter [Vibrio sp. V30_P3S12P165]NAX34656.1 EamA family transporter [Vibrio sp. V29_P1S30P107]NAX35909.1 EamA family transporter [Vibrio sp. V27_P1S3P104]